MASIMKLNLESKGLDVDLAERMKEAEIDGRSLELLGKDDVKEMFPELKQGKVILLMECIKLARGELNTKLKNKQTSAHDLWKEQPTRRQLETCRAFDTVPKATDVYEKGFALPEEQLRPGNLLEPIHKYCVVKDNDTTALATTAIRFAAACLNERVNGTIHFGVATKADRAGSMPGEIVGMVVDRAQCSLAVTDEIYRSFFADQIDVALSCIREPVCIAVVEKDVADLSLMVVEVDVVPRSEVVMEQAFFLKHSNGEKASLYRYIQGNAEAVDGKDLLDFMEHKKSLSELRKERETELQRCVFQEDLHRKLHHLLTGGNDYRVADIYPVLFLSPRSSAMTDEYLLENFRCIKSLDPLAVFDFDPLPDSSRGQPTGLFTMMEYRLGQVHKTLTTDNFDENSDVNKSSGHGCGVSKLFEDIYSSSSRTWIFCNGYGPLGQPEFPPAGWTRKRALGFKEAVRFYEKQIPTENARILIFVLSKACDVLLSGLEEVFAKFPDQWILLAETQKVAQDLISEILRRGYVEKDALEESSVIGMPWSHVNQSIMTIFGYSSGNGCKLTSSTGSTVHLKERKKNEWSDLKILSTNECADEAAELLKNGSQEDLQTKNRKTEEEYYRGAQVSWWNFFFKNHVLERDQTRELHERVAEFLNGSKIPKDERVGVVTLLHQPGAGATTIARQVLWNLKHKYRCCVVKQITDQTSDHIANLRCFEEQQSALPPVVLVDNEDFEKVCSLRSQLNEKARRLARGGKSVHNVFCVLIVCRRITRSVNKGKRAPHQDKACVLLDHELTPEDILWFQHKYEELEERYKEKQGLNPKLLFSFNILKENFSPNYIQRTVNELIDEIHDYRERRFLKFVSLINSFDLDFQSIPMSCFNAIMCPQPDPRSARPRLEQRAFSRGNVNWASALSQSLNVLLNRSSKPFCGKDIKVVRIVNNNLSKEILRNLCERDKETVSDVLLQFLHSDIFKRSNESTVQSQLGKLIKDVLRTRAVFQARREKFSPIITRIGETEGYSKAAEVLVVAFDIFEDPMLAQQIARVYIHTQDFDSALQFAKTATDMDPSNCYLLDTVGQVSKHKLLGMWEKVVNSKEQLDYTRAKEILDVAFTAIGIFRDEQALTDKALCTDYTNCGFICELHVISIVIDICRFLPPFRHNTEHLHRFLVDKHFVPEGLTGRLGEGNVDKLKKLHSDYEIPLKRLEDEEVQLKDDPAYQDSSSYLRNAENCHMLSKVKVRLLAIFGENTDKIPKELSMEEECEYRRRIVMRKGGASLFAVRKLREEKDALKTFESMYNMMYDNVLSDFCSADDFRSLLNLTVARISLDKNCAQTFSVRHAMEWASHLYEKTASLPVPNVEACLYLIMLHWPTEWRKRENLPLCPCSKIKEGIAKWKEAFLENHPGQKQRKKPDRRKATTLFFLGKGQGFDEIVIYSEFEHLQSTDGESIWDKEEVKCRLKQLTGTLHYGGKSVSVKLPGPDDSGVRLDICTSLPITDKSMWNRAVRFVLGFSWSGPKAFDVNVDIAEEELFEAAQTAPPPAKSYEGSCCRPTHEEMMTQEARFWKQHAVIQQEVEKLDTQLRTMAASEVSLGTINEHGSCPACRLIACVMLFRL